MELSSGVNAIWRAALILSADLKDDQDPAYDDEMPYGSSQRKANGEGWE